MRSRSHHHYSSTNTITPTYLRPFEVPLPEGRSSEQVLGPLVVAVERRSPLDVEQNLRRERQRPKTESRGFPHKLQNQRRSTSEGWARVHS